MAATRIKGDKKDSMRSNRCALGAGALRRAAVLLLALSGGAAALTGCGGGGGGSSSGLAHFRAVDAVPNGGQATVLFNGSSYTGTQGFSLNSVYLNLDSGSDTLSFTLTSPSTLTYSTVNQSLSSGSYYSAVAVGRTDVAPTDARYPRLVVLTDDPTTPPVGDTRLRVVQSAPDAGSVDLLIDGQVAASGVSYGAAGGYVNVAGGSHTVQINQAGTSTVLAPAQTVSPAAGTIYSIYILEEFEAGVTPLTPTYSFELLGDAR